MRYSRIYVPTLKDVMQETEALNYRLLHKAGFVRKDAAGIFTLLPFGNAVLQRLQYLIGNNLEKQNCFEVYMPNTVSKEDSYCSILSSKLSYKDLPLGAWLIREKSSDSIRPRLGLLQPKAWRNMEGFKLVGDAGVLCLEFEEMVQVFREILNDLDITVLEAEKLSWAYPSEFDKIFLLPYENGEDAIASCKNCGNSKLTDSMECNVIEVVGEPEKELAMMHTPQVKTIAEVAGFLKISAENIVKTLIYKADDRLYGILIRGDRDLSEAKLKQLLKCRSLRAATAKEVFEATDAEVGFAGPIGLKATIICDQEVAALKNIVTGANKTDYHYINVMMGRDYQADLIADLRCSTDLDRCPICGSEIKLVKGFMLGGVNKVQGQYFASQNLAYVSQQGKLEPVYILEYELNLHRVLAAIVEKHHDEAGLALPKVLAPYEVIVMAVHQDNEAQAEAAEQIYYTLKNMGYRTLLDDRAERVSIKFKDSELTGIPLRITVGRKISEGKIELKYRNKEMQEIHLDEILDVLLNNEVQYAEEA